MNIFALVVCLCGIYTITAAVCNWNWFFENYRASFIVNMVGREKARWFYGTLGALLMGASAGYYLLN